jgi:hypothetical protein
MSAQTLLTRKRPLVFNKTLLLIVFGILTVFILRTAAAARGNPPRLNDLFTAITLAGSLAVLAVGYRSLRGSDWILAVILGLVTGVTMAFTTLFSPYPFFSIVDGNVGQAFVRGFCVVLAALGGLVIMRQGGPVQVLAADGEWGKLAKSILFGLAVGLPFAVVNGFALQLTQGRPVSWQNPLAALMDALQPGIVEEVVYRFALLGLLWMALRKPLPNQAGWIAGLLALLVHNFMHFDELWLESPLVALGMGLVMALLWGLPPTILALRKSLDSAIAFHWIQDAARFLAGY